MTRKVKAKEYAARTIHAYDISAEKYERATASMIWTKELTAFRDALPDGDFPVLDAGCAYGRDSAWLAEHGLGVTGIDMSEKFVARASELNPSIQFQCADVGDLPFADQSFSGIWCNATLLHLNDHDVGVALAEFYRVLVVGGQIFLSFKEGSGSEEIVEKFSADASRYFNYQTQETVAAMVSDSGFRSVVTGVVNERLVFGADKRDLNWVLCSATKP